jgi:hypothetical protein
VSLLLLDTASAFARPFGIVRSSIPRPSPGHALSQSSIYFTPDSKGLIANVPHAALGFDLTVGKRFAVSDHFEKARPGTIVLQNAERAVVVENEKDRESKSFILSVKNGRILGNPQFSADRIRVASNPRYVIVSRLDSGAPSVGAFDLSENRFLDVPPNVGMDIFEGVMAVYNSSGFAALYRLEERQLLSGVRLPLSPLPALSAASITPALDQLAISVGGVGAMFQLSNGHRLGTFPRFTAVNFSNQQDATLVLASAHHDPPSVLHVSVSNGETSPAWEIPKEITVHSNGTVYLEYSARTASSAFWFDTFSPESQLPYSLRALDPASGKELWKRDFEEYPPTPFADPQGQRLVLGWRAKSPEAKSAAANNPAVNLIYKQAKLKDQDSFFEALDARTGKSLGGILVQVGNGAMSFDSAFSVGDSLVLVKDGVRVSLYSLADGQLKARLVGSGPSMSAENQLLALDLGSGRLGLYDSNSGAKLDEQLFPDDIAYAHFSSDGKRLFILTEHQAAVILDVGRVRETRTSNPEASEEK